MSSREAVCRDRLLLGRSETVASGGAERQADVPGFDHVAVVDIETGAADRFSYGDGWLVEEDLLIDRPDEVAPRWVIGTALDTRTDNTVCPSSMPHT